MSLKLKALGLSLMAMLAISAVAVMNASATSGGHFVSEGNSHVEVKGFAGPGSAHNLHLTNHGLEGEIGCDNQTYTATTNSETTTTITVSPSYALCHTTPTEPATPVTVNGCTYTFTVALNTGNTTEQTAHLVCPEGKKVEVHHPQCTVDIKPQTVNGGLTYTTATNASGVHEITMNVNVQFNTERHGLCQFIAPTDGTGTLKGSVTVKGFNTLGNQVPITAT